jgi:hypothetical protein
MISKYSQTLKGTIKASVVCCAQYIAGGEILDTY